MAIRRFSQVFRVFRPCFRGKEIRKIRRSLKRITDLAGEVRNCDIALKLLSKPQQHDPTGLRPRLANLRKERERALVGLLRNWVGRRASSKWRGAVANAATTNGEALSKTPITRTAQRILPRMAQEFFERGNEATKLKASPRELHEFRIAAKRFRYTLELFTSLYGPRLTSSLEKIRCAQGLLGDVNDCETVRGMLAQCKGSDGVTSWLKRRERRRIEEFQQYWMGTFAPAEESQRWRALLSKPAGRVGRAKKPAASVGLALQTTSRRRPAVA